MKNIRLNVTLAMTASALFLGSQLFLAKAPAAYAQSSSAQDNNIRAAVLNSLKKPQFKNVTVKVNNGVVDLEGTVQDFATKEEADKKAHRIKNVASVRNMIQIPSAGTISDAQLQQKLGKAIVYDRLGHWGQSPTIKNVTPFNAITVSVNNGVVTLGGAAVDPVSADSAVAIAGRTAGVRDVIDEIQVAPTSPMDDRTRLALYSAIYGYPSLRKYAIDPAQPIRIIVMNGKATLVGVVNTQADKDTAGIRANGVPNVFSVTNDLQVAGAANEKKP